MQVKCIRLLKKIVTPRPASANIRTSEVTQTSVFFSFLAAQLAGYQFLNQGLNLVEGIEEDMR